MIVWSVDDDNHKFMPIKDSEYCFFCQKHRDNKIHDTSGIMGNLGEEGKERKDEA